MGICGIVSEKRVNSKHVHNARTVEALLHATGEVGDTERINHAKTSYFLTGCSAGACKAGAGRETQ